MFTDKEFEDLLNKVTKREYNNVTINEDILTSPDSFKNYKINNNSIINKSICYKFTPNRYGEIIKDYAKGEYKVNSKGKYEYLENDTGNLSSYFCRISLSINFWNKADDFRLKEFKTTKKYEIKNNKRVPGFRTKSTTLALRNSPFYLGNNTISKQKTMYVYINGRKVPDNDIIVTVMEGSMDVYLPYAMLEKCATVEGYKNPEYVEVFFDIFDQKVKSFDYFDYCQEIPAPSNGHTAVNTSYSIQELVNINKDTFTESKVAVYYKGELLDTENYNLDLESKSISFSNITLKEGDSFEIVYDNDCLKVKTITENLRFFRISDNIHTATPINLELLEIYLNGVRQFSDDVKQRTSRVFELKNEIPEGSKLVIRYFYNTNNAIPYSDDFNEYLNYFSYEDQNSIFNQLDDQINEVTLGGKTFPIPTKNAIYNEVEDYFKSNSSFVFKDDINFKAPVHNTSNYSSFISQFNNKTNYFKQCMKDLMDQNVNLTRYILKEFMYYDNVIVNINQSYIDENTLPSSSTTENEEIGNTVISSVYKRDIKTDRFYQQKEQQEDGTVEIVNTDKVVRFAVLDSSGLPLTFTIDTVKFKVVIPTSMRSEEFNILCFLDEYKIHNNDLFIYRDVATFFIYIKKSLFDKFDFTNSSHKLRIKLTKIINNGIKYKKLTFEDRDNSGSDNAPNKYYTIPIKDLGNDIQIEDLVLYKRVKNGNVYSYQKLENSTTNYRFYKTSETSTNIKLEFGSIQPQDAVFLVYNTKYFDYKQVTVSSRNPDSFKIHFYKTMNESESTTYLPIDTNYNYDIYCNGKRLIVNLDYEFNKQVLLDGNYVTFLILKTVIEENTNIEIYTTERIEDEGIHYEYIDSKYGLVYLHKLDVPFSKDYCDVFANGSIVEDKDIEVISDKLIRVNVESPLLELYVVKKFDLNKIIKEDLLNFYRGNESRWDKFVRKYSNSYIYQPDGTNIEVPEDEKFENIFYKNKNIDKLKKRAKLLGSNEEEKAHSYKTGNEQKVFINYYRIPDVISDVTFNSISNIDDRQFVKENYTAVNVEINEDPAKNIYTPNNNVIILSTDSDTDVEGKLERRYRIYHILKNFIVEETPTERIDVGYNYISSLIQSGKLTRDIDARLVEKTRINPNTNKVEKYLEGNVPVNDDLMKYMPEGLIDKNYIDINCNDFNLNNKIVLDARDTIYPEKVMNNFIIDKTERLMTNDTEVVQLPNNENCFTAFFSGEHGGNYSDSDLDTILTNSDIVGDEDDLDNLLYEEEMVYTNANYTYEGMNNTTNVYLLDGNASWMNNDNDNTNNSQSGETP